MREYTGEYDFTEDEDGESYSAELILGAERLIFPSEYCGKSVSTVWVNEIGPENRCDVKEAVVPSGIRSLEGELFECFSSLRSITVSDSVEDISPNCISFCDSLFDISVDSNNKCYKSIDGCLYSKDGKTFVKAAPARIGENFEIPNGVEKIAERAFESCHKLKHIALPETLTEIERNAFMYCKSIEHICLPPGLKKIDSFAFSYCTSLADITFPLSLESVGYDIFCETNENLFVNCEADEIGPRWDEGWSESVHRVEWGVKGQP